MESAEVHTYHLQWIFCKASKTVQWGHTCLSAYGVGKLDIHVPKNKVRPFSHIIYKTELKIDHSLKRKS